MARRLEAIKLVVLADPIGQGFCEGFDMSFELDYKGHKILVFEFNLWVYIMLPEDYEKRGFIVKEEREILENLRDDFGREIRGLTLMTAYLH